MKGVPKKDGSGRLNRKNNTERLRCYKCKKKIFDIYLEQDNIVIIQCHYCKTTLLKFKQN